MTINQVLDRVDWTRMRRLPRGQIQSVTGHCPLACAAEPDERARAKRDLLHGNTCAAAAALGLAPMSMHIVTDAADRACLGKEMAGEPTLWMPIRRAVRLDMLRRLRAATRRA